MPTPLRDVPVAVRVVPVAESFPWMVVRLRVPVRSALVRVSISVLTFSRVRNMPLVEVPLLDDSVPNVWALPEPEPPMPTLALAPVLRPAPTLPLWAAPLTLAPRLPPRLTWAMAGAAAAMKAAVARKLVMVRLDIMGSLWLVTPWAHRDNAAVGDLFSIE